MAKKKLSVEDAAKEWIELKTMEATIEARRREIRAVLEPALEEAPDKLLEFHGWKFLLVSFERESFSLSKAKEKIDGRILAPYITASTSVQIRATWKGGAERADKGNA
jgi:hypothetical protein